MDTVEQGDASGGKPPSPSVGTIIFWIGLIAAVLFAFLSTNKPSPQNGVASHEEPHIYRRQELYYALLGRPGDEVIEIIGRPASSSPQSQPGSEYWYYSNPPTWDEAADKRDDSMIVYFTEGRVSRLAF
jgi:hypothetical protein